MKKIFKGVFIFVTLCLTQSCMQEIEQIEGQQPTTEFKDLNVPSTFDWVTSKNIICTVNSNAPTSIEVYTDEVCKDELLATFTSQQGSNQLSMSISQATKVLYLKYKTTGDTYKVLTGELRNNVVTFSITDGALTQGAGTRSATTRDGSIESHDGYISYPAKWGTVMFEDQYPALGDYDFNDFVASYQIAVEFPWKDGGYDTKHAKMIRVHLKLRAIGGSLGLTPFVRIVGLKKANVTMPNPAYGDSSYPNPGIFNNTTDGVKVSLADGSLTDDVIIEYKNLNASNPNAAKDAQYYNTIQGKTMKESQLTQVNVYLALNEEVEVEKLLDDKIDIFLASEDKSKEIHLRGFNPVFSEYDYTAAGVSKDVTYASDKNLIWGLKLAVSKVKHVVEKANFCSVYHDFASWAESEGTINQDWYNTRVDDKNLFKWAN